jgi:tetratricopeptide (TPR) repeat protein
MEDERKKMWNDLMDVWDNVNVSCHLYFAKLYTDKFPNEAAGWIALADVLSGMARYSEARDALRRAKFLSPKERYYFVFHQFGHLYMEKGDYLRAEKWYRKALEKKETTSHFIFLGACLAKQGKFSEAKKCHKKALKIASETPDEAYYNLGLILRAEEKFEEALNYFEKAIKLNPEYKLAKEAKRDIKNLLQYKKKAKSRLKLV